MGKYRDGFCGTVVEDAVWYDAMCVVGTRLFRSVHFLAIRVTWGPERLVIFICGADCTIA